MVRVRAGETLVPAQLQTKQLCFSELFQNLKFPINLCLKSSSLVKKKKKAANHRLNPGPIFGDKET